MEHLPGEQASAERAADPDQYCHRDPHGIRARQEQAGQGADQQATEEQNDQKDDKTHGRILPAGVLAGMRPLPGWRGWHSGPVSERVGSCSGRPRIDLSPSRSFDRGGPTPGRSPAGVAGQRRVVSPRDLARGRVAIGIRPSGWLEFLFAGCD